MRFERETKRPAGRPRRWRRTFLAIGITGLLATWGAGALAQDVHEVEVADDEFVPPTIEVAEGDTVRWTHSGSNPHSVTADDGSFDSHPVCPPDCMEGGDTFEQTFDAAGEFGYYCRIHGSPGSGMAASVTVVASAEDDPESDEAEPDDAGPDDAGEDAEPEETEAVGEADEAGSDGEPTQEVAEAEDRAETLPVTGAGLVAPALLALVALGAGAVLVRRSHLATHG